jgi:hypothetical protein
LVGPCPADEKVVEAGGAQVGGVGAGLFEPVLGVVVDTS